MKYPVILLLALCLLTSWLADLPNAPGSTLAENQPVSPLPPSSPPAQQWVDKGTPFGIEASLGNRVRADEMDEAVALMQEAGVQWQREEIFWDRVQQQPDGPFTWTGDRSGLYNYDLAIEVQVSAGIQVLGLLDYNPAWFKSQNPPLDAWIDDWGDFVYTTVARYGRDRGWITHWELWNEPNVAESGYESGLYDPGHFARILEVGRAAAKAADPDAQIVMGGVAGILERPEPFDYDWLDYLEQVGQAGGWQHVDILAIHFYQPEAPENPIQRYDRWSNLRGELQFLEPLMERYGYKPVWITELGWSTSSGWPGVSLDDQAFYLVRAYILALVHPAIEKIFWYDFRNDTWPTAPYEYPAYQQNEVNFHFGLLRRSYPLNPVDADLRKPSFLAFRTMTRMLSGLSIHDVRAEGYNGRYWYKFRGMGRRVDVLWRTTSESPSISIACGCREALVRRWNGEVRGLVLSNDGMINVQLDSVGAPFYIEYDPPSAPDGEYFATTQHALRGTFRQFWHTHAGLTRFGYPLTEELIEPVPGSGLPQVVQYFERARLEYMPHNPSAGVQIARLGEQALAQQGIDWHTLPRVATDDAACLSFAATGHTLCPPFRAAWEGHGGLEFAGYPLTEPFEVQPPDGADPYLVQYFERVRMEAHAQEGGSSMIQFGLLVRELFVYQGQLEE